MNVYARTRYMYSSLYGQQESYHLSRLICFAGLVIEAPCFFMIAFSCNSVTFAYSLFRCLINLQIMLD
ncbi:hypothetical protein Hdeb2414_s0021g00572591 [Helianthus debilis subsp. tardiflorus]